MADFLRKITEKDTIISTVSADQITKNPQQVENYYSEIASTHMSIGETDQISKRIVRCLVDNQRTFNGAVVGEYGFGKTSLLIYLWDYCLENSVLAIPPYQWSKFMDHFQAIYSWTKYQISKKSYELSEKFEVLFKRIIDPSIETRAKEWAINHGVTFDQAKAILEGLMEQGKIDLELNSTDLMEFCREVSEFLLQNTGWRGLLIITDELQQTISKLNRNTVYEHLFDITNHLAGSNGSYGFLWGFPLNTHADLGATRGDILDRLNSNGSFVRLSEIYDRDFPTYLWNKYCQVFDIDQEKYPVVDRNTLIAIGQVCDGARKDIGNGPRSTISAFNVMARYFLETQTTYKVTNFIEDCLNREIMLGETSDYVQRINEVLTLDDLGKEFGDIIKLLAAFPAGVPSSVLREDHREEELEAFIKHTGGLGKVIVKNVTSYMLKIMRPKGADISDESAIEREVRQFYSEYSPDISFKNKAHKVFDDILEKNIFTEYKGSGAFEKWSAEKWIHRGNVHACVFTGSFDSRYPERKVSILTAFKTDEELKHDVDDSHLNFQFVSIADKALNKVIKVGNKTYRLNLDLMHQSVLLGNHRINDIIPEEKHNPMLFVCLIDYLNSANIPNDEFPDRDYLIKKLEENVIYNIFSEDMLGEIEGSEIELDSQGEHLIHDLFSYAIKELYPDYSTIMIGRGWKNKMVAYENALNQEIEGWSLMEKRGKEDVILSLDKKDNKEKIASLFGQSSANFESWLTGMNNLLEYKFDTKGSYFRLKCHPLEQILIDTIQNKGKTKHINGVDCKWLTLDPSLISELFQMGYVQEEIMEIIKIGSSRKYFNIDKLSQSIYMKPEDKDELKNNCRQFVQIVKEQIENLNGLPDYRADFEELGELENKIDAIESGEQAEKIQNQLKRLQSNNKHYTSKEIDKLKIDAAQTNRQADGKGTDLNGLKNKFEEIRKNTDGKALWIADLLPIITNLDNEMAALKTKIETSKRKFSNFCNIVVLNNRGVINQFTAAREEFQAHAKDWEDICQSYSDTEKRIGFLNKWIQIRKLHDQILDDLYKYEAILEDSLKDQLELLNARVSEQLKNNQKLTLENNEQYYNQFYEIKAKLQEAISSSRSAWVEKCTYYETKIKEVTGKEPDWRLRWTNPLESYDDLYQRAGGDCRIILDRLESEVSSLNDDLIYSMEVLNHKRAIQNKKIDSRLKELLTEIGELKNKHVDSIVNNQADFESLVLKLKQFNTAYNALNRDHRSIVQTIKVDDPKELAVLDLIGKEDGSDLKKVIISYQKRSGESIDLTTSRDEVLFLIKELFLKKQITISVKKGKL